jgi:uncharacterized Tic20 family protein
VHHGDGGSPLGLAGYVVPFGNIIGPLVVWLTKKDESAFVAEHARQALNFQISMTIYFILAALSMLVLIGFLLLPCCWSSTWCS